MSERPKILLLDDDPEFLELYQELFVKLPSNPELRTATSGARAITMLEAEPFSLLVTDLHMPHMDGLQVLAIVRKKFPQLRTAVLTGIVDEQFRIRAYAMGLDLYLEKPTTAKNTQLLLDCVESLLGQDPQGGFRGMQSKGLVDIIQLECLCRSSTVLKIMNGAQEGKIWFQSGDIVDAATSDLTGEAAFQKILSWKTGSFEILPAEPAHPRAIFNSHQGLLLETAQALDEAKAQSTVTEAAAQSASSASPARQHPALGKEVEFSLVLRENAQEATETWAVENPQAVANWVRQTYDSFRSVGEDLKVGSVTQIIGSGFQNHVAIAAGKDRIHALGFQRSMTLTQVQESLKKILAQWEN